MVPLDLAQAAKKVSDLAYALHFGRLSDPARLERAVVELMRVMGPTPEIQSKAR